MALFAFLVAFDAFAQNASGTISGTVFDPSSAPFADATVQVRNIATARQYQVQSSSTGGYTLSGLPPGTYELSVVVHGDQLYTQQNVAVEGGKSARVDAHLTDTNLGALGDGEPLPRLR